jgi:tRNA(adenine34) deaminase
MTELHSTAEYWMEQALELAREAKKVNEVPVGAIVVLEGKVIGLGSNTRENAQDPCGHAEIHALQSAAKKINNWRLSKCVMYVTLEPCIMCAGAIIQARIERVVYGAKDPKGGALGSLYNLHEDTRLNHRFEIQSGVLEDQCSELLKVFFREKRT